MSASIGPRKLEGGQANKFQAYTNLPHFGCDERGLPDGPCAGMLAVFWVTHHFNTTHRDATAEASIRLGNWRCFPIPRLPSLLSLR